MSIRNALLTTVLVSFAAASPAAAAVTVAAPLKADFGVAEPASDFVVLAKGGKGSSGGKSGSGSEGRKGGKGGHGADDGAGHDAGDDHGHHGAGHK